MKNSIYWVLICFSMMSCAIYKSKDFYILEDRNTYTKGDNGIKASEVYFLKKNRESVNKRLISKRVRLVYNNFDKDIQFVTKKIKTVSNAFHFDRYCDGSNVVFGGLAIVDTIQVSYNIFTKEITYFDTLKKQGLENNKNIKYFEYYVYHISECTLNSKKN